MDIEKFECASDAQAELAVKIMNEFSNVPIYDDGTSMTAFFQDLYEATNSLEYDLYVKNLIFRAVLYSVVYAQNNQSNDEPSKLSGNLYFMNEQGQYEQYKEKQ